MDIHLDRWLEHLPMPPDMPDAQAVSYLAMLGSDLRRRVVGRVGRPARLRAQDGGLLQAVQHRQERRRAARSDRRAARAQARRLVDRRVGRQGHHRLALLGSAPVVEGRGDVRHPRGEVPAQEVGRRAPHRADRAVHPVDRRVGVLRGRARDPGRDDRRSGRRARRRVRRVHRRAAAARAGRRAARDHRRRSSRSRSGSAAARSRGSARWSRASRSTTSSGCAPTPRSAVDAAAAASWSARSARASRASSTAGPATAPASTSTSSRPTPRPTHRRRRGAGQLRRRHWLVARSASLCSPGCRASTTCSRATTR